MEYPIQYYGPNGTHNRDVCMPIKFPIPEMGDIIYGYIVPIIALTTLGVNSLALLVFMTTNRKSPTNIVLSVLAVSNIISICSISPMYFLVYGLKKIDIYIKCLFIIYHDSAYYVTSMFHCFSIWLTVLLGVQRYIVVGFPMSGPHFCNRRNTIVSIIVTFFLSFLVMIVPNLWSKKYYPITLNVSQNALFGYSNATDVISEREFCLCPYEPFEMRFHILYTWMRNVFGTTVPCVILLITTILLIFELHIKKDNRKIREILFDNNCIERKEHKSMKRASKLVMAITAFFLLTELPNAIFFTWIIAEPHAYDSVLDSKARFTSSIICNLLVFTACTANFFILVLMSRYFRRKLKYFLFMSWLNKPFEHRKQKRYSTFSSKSTQL